jgi:hypothetical protein
MLINQSSSLIGHGSHLCQNTGGSKRSADQNNNRISHTKSSDDNCVSYILQTSMAVNFLLLSILISLFMVTYHNVYISLFMITFSLFFCNMTSCSSIILSASVLHNNSFIDKCL